MYYGHKVPKSNPNYLKYKKQRRRHGFDDTELWNLDFTIASFILPRLRRFKEINKSYPAELKPDEWEYYLDTMITAFQLIIEENDTDLDTIEDGLKYFAKYFRDLWD